MIASIPAIKQHAKLPDHVAQYLTLTRRGKTLWGRCPFHNEKTASFAVHEKYFFCHGCQAKGDVIDFTARIEGTSKGRAIRALSERYSLPVGPAPTRQQSAYLRDLRHQAEFWWARRRAAAVRDLEHYVARAFSEQSDRADSLASAAGARVRLLDSISPVLRGRIFLHLRTEEDNIAWAAHLRWMEFSERMARNASDWEEILLIAACAGCGIDSLPTGTRV
jgi:hypothetical protein